MRRKLFIALALLVVVAMQAQTYWNGTSNQVFSGSGTQADPYLISTPEQLAGLAERVNNNENFEGKYIQLTSDLYMSDPNAAKEDKHEWVPIGKMTITQDPLDQWSMTFDTCRFNGTFDGGGHTIYHLYMGTVGEVSFGSLEDPTQEDVLDFSGTDHSFFGYIDGGSVSNLTISDLGLAATGNMGGLAAVVQNGYIKNVHVKDSRIIQSNVLGNACGGLIGSISNTTVENCSAENVVVQAVVATGFIGNINNNSVVRHCHATGYTYAILRNVASTVNNLGSAAGFCNSLDGSSVIDDCNASVQVNVSGGPISTIHNASWAGGFVNSNAGTIRNSYATGDGAGANAAGFCVQNTGLIESCYAMGNVTSGGIDNPAAFVRSNGYEDFVLYVGTVAVYPGIVRNCFSTGTCYEGEQPLTYGFLTYSLSTHSANGGMDSEGSQNISCWFNNDNVTAAQEGSSKSTAGTIGATTAFMQSQAFVDTLNIVAALFGLNKWQFNAGAYPTITNEKATDISAIFGGGNGSKESPWLIDNMQHLTNMRALVNLGMDFRGLYIKQTTDIELNAPQDQWAIQMPTQWTPIADTRLEPKFNYTNQYVFRGTYDGGFHEIKNMYISNMKEGQAFFGQVGRGAVVKNLGVTNGYIKQDGSVAASALLIGGFPRYEGNITIAQCWTSGSVDYFVAPVNYFAAGALVASLPLEGNVRMLNCSSSASLKAHDKTWAAAPDLYHVGAGQNDTVGNFLYTGGPLSFVPNDGYAYNFNAFYDCNNYPTHKTEREAYSHYGRSTTYLQSDEFVNVLNDYVDAWNAKNEFQLNYWEKVEGDYPRVSATAIPPHTVTYNSQGGSEIAARHVLGKSFMLPPDKPTKEGFIFAGWYSDASCTQFFDYDKTPVTGSMTLYAKWLVPTYDTYDLTPFDNTFATEYHITNKAQLIGFVKAVNGIEGVRSANSFEGKTIYLDADILLNDTADWRHWGRFAYAESWEPIGLDGNAFRGHFEGQGHTISGLYYDGDVKHYKYQGLFGSVGANGVTGTAIRQLGVQASAVKAYGNAGLLVGCFRRDALLEQCFATGTLIFWRAETSATSQGGLAGILGGEYAGEGGSTVKDCFARVNVYTPYQLGNEKAPLEVTGCAFSAYISKCTLTNCYAAGLAKTGGFESSSTTRTNCFYDKELISSSSATPKTTNQMHAIFTFTDWDFETIWGRNESINAGYPYLRCFVSNPPDNDPDAPIVTGVEMEETTVTLIAGDSIQLHASVVPETALNKKIYWSSNKTNFATVDENGFVRTIADISKHNTEAVIITVTTDEGAYTKKCTLNIQYPSLTVSQLVAQRRIGESTWETASSKVTAIVGYEYTIFAYSDPSEAHTPVLWSADETLVTIIPETENTTYTSYAASKAILRPLNDGSITITATDERGLTAARALTLKRVEVSSIKLPYSSKSLYVGETLELVPTITPAEVSEIPQLIWTSSEPEVASVDENGVVTALQVGSSVITVACGTLTASVTITVNPVLPTSVSLNETSIELPVGQTFQLVASILPENATDKTITWSSDRSSNASVDENGLVTALSVYKKGSSIRTITITAKTSNNKSASCEVKVVEAVEPPAPDVYEVAEAITAKNNGTIVNNDSISVRGIITKIEFKQNNFSSYGSACIYVKDATGQSGSFEFYNCYSLGSAKFTSSNPTHNPSSTAWLSVTSVTDAYNVTVAVGDTVTGRGKYNYYNGTHELNSYCFLTDIKSAQTVTPPEPTYYTIRFLNWDGTELQSSQVEEGDMPTYTGATPTRAEDEQYTYAFNGWSPTIVSATADADYTAQYIATEKPVTPPEHDPITVRLNPNSATGWSNVYLYSWIGNGETQPCGAWPGTKVSKDADGWWTYTFDKEIQNVNIIWNNGSGAQTVDITGVTASTCYRLNGTTGTKITVTVINCNSAQDTEEVNSDKNATPRKVLINGLFYILTPDGTIYNAQGAKIK